MTRGPALKAEEYRELAAQEAELATSAATNERRAQHYAVDKAAPAAKGKR